MLGKFLCLIGWHCDHRTDKPTRFEARGRLCRRRQDKLYHIECCRCLKSCWIVVND